MKTKKKNRLKSMFLKYLHFYTKIGYLIIFIDKKKLREGEERKAYQID